MDGELPVDPEGLNQKVHKIWNRNAVWWDHKVGEGNTFQKILVGPATERLLDVQPGELVVDIACGSGIFSRRMADLGAQVVAFDFSEKFLECAAERTTKHADRIEYYLMDATDTDQLLTLGKRRFDAAVCTMALMDMTVIDPLMSALSQLLKVGGRFIFSVLHPCFNSTGCNLMVEEEYKNGEFVLVYSVKVSKYIQPMTAEGIGIIGQPIPQYYFHRPMSVLFNTCFAAGFVLDGLEEPVFCEATERKRSISWENYKEIPPVLVARLRLL